MPSHKIIIDTDPGQDDAIAILLALAAPEEIDLLGIVTVAGNVPLALTSRNALMLCELAKKPETKVFAGCSRPLVRPLVTAEHVHGKTGLDGADLPAPTILPAATGAAKDVQVTNASAWLDDEASNAEPAAQTGASTSSSAVSDDFKKFQRQNPKLNKCNPNHKLTWQH